jgi:molecular chaperone DnaK
MVRDAEAHAAEDRRRREEVDARNELDGVAYQVERLLRELGDRAAEHERARAEALVADARSALEQGGELGRLRELTGDLQQVLQSLSASGQARAGVGGREGDGAGGDDDVIDAEYDE